MNLRASQRAYRAPYVYFAQSEQRAPSPVIRIGHTLRPGYELQRMQRRYPRTVLLAHARAFMVLAPILWQRFAYCGVGGQWFALDRRLSHLVALIRARDAEVLLAVDDLRAVLAAVFPEAPYVGVREYRLSETYLRRSRINTY